MPGAKLEHRRIAFESNAQDLKDDGANPKFGRQEFVVLPKREYERLIGSPTKRSKTPPKSRWSQQDRGDIADARRRLAEPGAGIPWKQVKSELGL